ncbi:PREDICTED: cuticle protein CP14.6-like [Papilio polytes]|uniref:Cuticular protein PpolCPR3 n=1 Tax=Papilio polytes TaxID=76194 RepID=I4DLT5_PAPPL|nr:cuticle protein CP14.6-like precursor [Papilio polytes]BAM18875.1 cuticular protein PpolCPR3 [Papilio polytes]
MRTFIALFALVAVVVADVPFVRSPEADAPIISQDADVFPDQYQYKYETGNGISASETGVLKNAGREDEALQVEGQNRYTAPDGSVIVVTYIANENGYQPQGAHLPVAPEPEPIPEYILRSIEYNRLHAPKTIDGQRR